MEKLMAMGKHWHVYPTTTPMAPSVPGVHAQPPAALPCSREEAEEHSRTVPIRPGVAHAMLFIFSLRNELRERGT